MSKRRSSVYGKRGSGTHQPEHTKSARPPGEVKPVISTQKHGKPMIQVDEFHDTEEAPTTGIKILAELASIRRGCFWFAGIMAILCLLVFFTAVKANGQTDFISPFHFVVTNPQPGSKSITDIYHVPTHVVITETTVSIGVDSEGGSRFNYPIQGVELETDRVRYIIPDGIIVHTTNSEGECVTWSNSRFRWRLYSFLPKLVEIEN